MVTYKKANSELFLKTSAGILFIWFPRKNLRQDSYKIWIGANVSSVPFDYDFSTASQSNRNNQLKGKKLMKAVRTKNNTNKHMALSFSDGGWPGCACF